ncbi:MAG TPA: hypothetical protein VII53_10525 [Solirubrobacteraceae bacterium]
MAAPDLLTRLRGKGPDLLTRISGEFDARLRELRPLLAEYERLLGAADALEAERQAKKDTPGRALAPTPPASTPKRALKPAAPRRDSKPASKRAQRGATGVAILAALEHGSHTASELVIVTAISGPVIQSNLRRLQQAGAITRSKRAGDGKAAYALALTHA